MKMMKSYKTVSEYIVSYPKDVQANLKLLRQTIKKIAPKAEEGISYGMPAYKRRGKPLVYFAGFKNHIGFYPFPSGVTMFKKLSTKYKTSKGTIQFPVPDKLPLPLITKIVKFRLKQVNAKK